MKTDKEARIAALEAQLAEARSLVAEANNSLYGSHSYFHSTNGGEFDKYHLARPIEELKDRSRRLSALEATPPAPKVTEIVWHRLIDGDPEKTGRYIVGHRGMSAPATYHDDGPIKGWDRSVEAFTHWAIEPRAPDDGTPQLFKPEGQRLRQEALEIASWNALTAAQEAGKP